MSLFQDMVARAFVVVVASEVELLESMLPGQEGYLLIMAHSSKVTFDKDSDWINIMLCKDSEMLKLNKGYNT